MIGNFTGYALLAMALPVPAKLSLPPPPVVPQDFAIISGRTITAIDRLPVPDRETAKQDALQVLREMYAKQDNPLARALGVDDIKVEPSARVATIKFSAPPGYFNADTPAAQLALPKR